VDDMARERGQQLEKRKMLVGFREGGGGGEVVYGFVLWGPETIQECHIGRPLKLLFGPPPCVNGK